MTDVRAAMTEDDVHAVFTDHVRAAMADRRRGQRIRGGYQRTVEVPVDVLRDLLAGSAHSRDIARRAFGERTTAALMGAA